MSRSRKVIFDQPVIIEKLVPGGQGLATLPDGKKAFFWNALPSESVLECKITKQKSKYVEAISTKIKAPSPHRIVPKDPCYLSTSPWQIMSYDYELLQKYYLLAESFRQEGLMPLVKCIVGYNQTSKTTTLRTVSELRRDARDANLLTEKQGFTNPDSIKTANDRNGQQQLLSVAHCTGYGRAIAAEPRDDGREDGGDTVKRLLLPMTDGNDFRYRNKMEYSLYFDHNDQKIHLAFHQRGSHRKIPIETSSIERPEILQKAKEIIADLNARGEEARKYQSLLLRCDQKGNVSGGLYENGKPHPVFKNLTDEILGHEYSYSPNGFFQINLPVYEMALKEIKNHITTDNVLDLYSGVGTIGLSVARNKNLTLVEVNESAYHELEKNCQKLRRATHSVALRSSRASDRGPAPMTTGGGNPGEDEGDSPKLLAVLSKSEEVLDYISPDQTVILDPPSCRHRQKTHRSPPQSPPRNHHLPFL